jgi:hypothetical protein
MEQKNENVFSHLKMSFSEKKTLWYAVPSKADRNCQKFHAANDFITHIKLYISMRTNNDKKRRGRYKIGNERQRL